MKEPPLRGCLLCSLLLALGCAQFDPAALAFGEWMQKYNKSYPDQYQLAARFNLFTLTYNFTVKQNAQYQNGSSTFQVELNEFAAASASEKSKLLGVLKNNNSTSYNHTQSQQDSWNANYAHITPPKSVNWVAAKKISPVKGQELCASDWAFAAVGAIEGAAAIAGGFSWPDGADVGYSTEEIVDCGYSPAGSHSDDEGCNGGQVKDAIMWATKFNLTTAARYPYTPPQGWPIPPPGQPEPEHKPQPCNATLQSQGSVSVGGYQLVPPSNETALKQAVSLGPVAATMQGGCLGFFYYGSGILDPTGWSLGRRGLGNCSTIPSLNHGVLVVGYNSTTEFALGEIEYWIIKNSWGAWGEDGYASVAMAAAGAAGLYSEPVFPIGVKGPPALRRG